jgi:hypothetical protein
MLMSEILHALQQGGVPARHWHVRHLLAAGDIEPPPRDASGRFQFSEDDLRSIQRRLAARRRQRRGTHPTRR